MMRRATAADRLVIEQLQADAYAAVALVINNVPVPLFWDYGVVLETWDVWLLDDAEGVVGVLLLQTRLADLYLHSIAVHPRAQGRGLASQMLAFVEDQARLAGRSTIRLITNEKNLKQIAIYEHKGYRIERSETLADRRAVHMIRVLGQG